MRDLIRRTWRDCRAVAHAIGPTPRECGQVLLVLGTMVIGVIIGIVVLESARISVERHGEELADHAPGD